MTSRVLYFRPCGVAQKERSGYDARSRERRVFHDERTSGRAAPARRMASSVHSYVKNPERTGEACPEPAAEIEKPRPEIEKTRADTKESRRTP
jgi:hypothetical protein